MNFGTCHNKGFHITFENGWTISVQFGPGNYCDNYHGPIGASDERGIYADQQSTVAEVAAWDSQRNWLRFDTGDIVAGYQTPAQLLAFMNLVASKKPDEHGDVNPQEEREKLRKLMLEVGA